MHRILIWGCGLWYSRYINAVKYQEMMGNIKVIGVTGKDTLYPCLDGYMFIPLDEVQWENIDYVVVMTEEHYGDICEMAAGLGFEADRMIQGRVFCLPYFSFDEYVNLLRTKVSIIANNCWGGTAYHALGMPFFSPFINMFLQDADYLKLLGSLQYYLKRPLQFKKMDYNSVLERDYPVCQLDDVELHFNHYVSMEEVERKWNDRLGRLNWNNLFIMMFTEDYQAAEHFDSLPYDKKICFVPFGSPLQSAFCLQVAAHKEMQGVPFWEIVNKTASGYFHDYDLMKLLDTGKINHDRYCINLK